MLRRVIRHAESKQKQAIQYMALVTLFTVNSTEYRLWGIISTLKVIFNRLIQDELIEKASLETFLITKFSYRTSITSFAEHANLYGIFIRYKTISLTNFYLNNRLVGEKLVKDEGFNSNHFLRGF